MVEVAVFAPELANPALRELAGIPVCDQRSCKKTKSAGITNLITRQLPPTQDTKLRSNTPMFVATGSRDKTIRIWDATTGQCLKVLVGCTPH